jgi:DNA phosphorothioation-associated putative methyltransferase
MLKENGDDDRGRERRRPDDHVISLHLTALSRYDFSTPVRALSRYGLIDSNIKFFDYGCGRGNDIQELIENGIDARGWDPHFAPENSKVPSDVVTPGGVRTKVAF